MIKINIKTDYLWKQYKLDNLSVWIKGYIYNYSIEKIISICKNIKKENVSSFISNIDGHFSIILQREDLTFIAVDKIRSTPLYFVKIKKIFS